MARLEEPQERMIGEDLEPGASGNSFEEHGEVEVVRKGEIAAHGMLMGTIQ